MKTKSTSTTRDTVRDWSKLKKNGNTSIPLDKNFAKHEIKPTKYIGIIGPSGSGKTNSLLEFLSRKNETFEQVIYFTGSTRDEDLLNILEENMPGIELIDDVEELPKLEDYRETDKTKEKLIVFDDLNNLDHGELKEISKWFNSARKLGFTVVFLAQNFFAVPNQIRRQVNYIFMFRQKDKRDADRILEISNDGSIPIELLRHMYLEATKDIGNFFKIDLTESDPAKRYRRNFIGTF